MFSAGKAFLTLPIPSGAAPADLITNGALASTTGWTGWGSGGMSISGGKAHYASTPAFNGIFQTIAPTNGKYYELTFTISSYTSGGLYTVFLNGTSPPTGTIRTANGTYVERLLAGTSNTQVQLRASAAGTTLDFDDVSLIGPYNTSTVGGA